jgi:hypothetical protein
MIEAVPLILRLVASKNAGDKVATLFRHRLAPASRAKLINILRRRITQ